MSRHLSPSLSFVAHHGSLGSTVILVRVLDHGAYDLWVLRMVGLTGLIRESVSFTADEIHLWVVFVAQGLVRNGDEECMAAMILVPSETAQFSGFKRLVDEEPFQVRNQRGIVLKYFRVVLHRFYDRSSPSVRSVLPALLQKDSQCLKFRIPSFNQSA